MKLGRASGPSPELRIFGAPRLFPMCRAALAVLLLLLCIEASAATAHHQYAPQEISIEREDGMITLDPEPTFHFVDETTAGFKFRLPFKLTYPVRIKEAVLHLEGFVSLRLPGRAHGSAIVACDPQGEAFTNSTFDISSRALLRRRLLFQLSDDHWDVTDLLQALVDHYQRYSTS